MYDTVVYIAGNISAENAWEQEQNVRRAEEACKRLWIDHKIPNHCPHTQHRFFGGLGDGWECFLAGDLATVRASDIVLLLPGWETSRGAKLEMAYAKQLGKLVFEDELELVAYVKKHVPFLTIEDRVGDLVY